MKKIIVLMAAVAAIVSCAKESVVSKASDDRKEYTIGILPIGDISASYSPLTKAGTSETTWYGINIKRDGSDYLVGLFDDISLFKVKLSTKHYYSFELTAITGVSENMFYSSTDKVLRSDGRYYDVGLHTCVKWPFTYIKGAPVISGDVLNTLNTGYYYIWSDEGMRNLPYLSEGKNSNEWYRFYGTKNNFTPSKDETLPFTLKHEGFGLQYTVSGICDGSVSVVIDNAQTENTVTYFSQPAITSDFASPQKVIEFRDMTSETEQVKVTVVWTRGNNVVDNLGSTTVNVRRNKINKINITLGEHSSSKSMSVSTDASDYFGNESSNITI